MIEDKEMQKLLLKFIQNECSAEEITHIINYVKKVKGTDGLPSFEEVLSLLDELPETKPEKAAALYAQIQDKVKQQSTVRSKSRIWKYASVAAVFIGVLAVGYFYQQGAFDSSEEGLLVPAHESITLQLEDGSIQVIDPTSSKTVRDAQGNLVANQDQSQLDYTEAGGSEVLVYNTLTVPYGKRFDVVLSDGTTVYLNSGTELKYPVSFLDEGNREVFVEGEAYFDVTSDTDRPFIVNAEALNVEVLGTEFNVFAYPEDARTDVVLVEGSVALAIGESTGNTVLSPGEKGIMDRVSQTIDTEKVNTNIYTAWRKGELVFRRMPFENLVKKLERHYNVTIEIENETLKKEVFSASFNNETIETVLGFLNDSYNIEYIIKDNTVYIQ